ncbi:MAG: ATP-binding protein, partial [Acidobacteriaceae bacterium]
MSRVLIIDSQTPVSHEVGELLTGADLPFEYAAGHIDALHRLRCRAFGVIITSADGVIDEALALLQ